MLDKDYQCKDYVNLKVYSNLLDRDNIMVFNDNKALAIISFFPVQSFIMIESRNSDKTLVNYLTYILKSEVKSLQKYSKDASDVTLSNDRSRSL